MGQDLAIQYEIDKADLRETKQEILRVWKENLGSNSEARYAWIYEGNPFGSAACWVVKEARGRAVIGSVALFPKRVWVRGKPQTAGIVGDFAVAKTHRGGLLPVSKTPS